MPDALKDLVCGADIKVSEAAAVSEFNGSTYYFCCPGCKHAFDREPEKYLAPVAPAHTHACC
jgi:YHS domain-containing protein